MRMRSESSLSRRLERHRLARRLAGDRPGARPADAGASAHALPPGPPSSAGRFLRDLGRNVSAGFALAAFRRVGDDRIAASLTQVVALAALALALALADDYVRVGAAGQFFAWGVPGALFFLPLALLAAALFALLAGDERRALPVLVGLLALALPIELAAVLAQHFVVDARQGAAAWRAYEIVAGTATAWHALAAFGAAVRLGRVPLVGLRRVAAAAVAAGVLAWPTTYLERDSQLWMPRETPTESASSNEPLVGASEAVFYRQPALLESELAAVRPGRKGVVELYFVGVGGWAGQDVFMREIRYTRELFERRFGAAGRTVALINNPRTALEAPIASVTALERTLQRLAAVMDRDEDVLFLFLTSHGSQDHRFSLEFWPLALAPLDPPRLKSLLAASGIKWKVVVVSACYSGGFVDALKDETTVVITASAADRNSFGCSHEAEFTYFGRAYFDEALRATRSFTEAFAIAKDAVTRKEIAEQKTPSLPQMHVGAAIGEQLKRLEAELADGSGATARR